MSLHFLPTPNAIHPIPIAFSSTSKSILLSNKLLLFFQFSSHQHQILFHHFKIKSFFFPFFLSNLNLFSFYSNLKSPINPVSRQGTMSARDVGAAVQPPALHHCPSPHVLLGTHPTELHGWRGEGEREGGWRRSLKLREELWDGN